MKNFYPNSTQVPNILFDEYLPILSDTGFRILMIIVRQTYGWIEDKKTKRRKDKDWISYSQLMIKTGRVRQSVSTALRELEEKDLIQIFDDSGRQLFTMDQRRGKSLYYRINTSLKTGLVVPVKSKNRSPKIRHTKLTGTKLIKTIGKAQLNKNGDNSVDNVRIINNGLTKIKFDTLKTKPYKFKNEDLFLAYSKTKITTPHQAWGYLAVDELDLPISLLPRVIKSFKGKNYIDIKNAISKITVHTKLRNANDRVKYLFKII